jgi:hypothetical protein
VDAARIRSVWTLGDVVRAHRMLDYYDEIQEEKQRKIEQETGSNSSDIVAP